MYTVTLKEKGGTAKEMDFDQEQITIGRIQGNDIVLPKGNISKSHAKIVCKDEKFIVADLKSTNGTFVNGKKIVAPQVVLDTDKIYIGDFVITLQLLGAPSEEEEELSPIEETGDPLNADEDVFAMEESEVSSVDDASDSYSSEEELSDEAELGSLASEFSDADQPVLEPDEPTAQLEHSEGPEPQVAEEVSLPEAPVAEPAEEPQAAPSPEFTKEPELPADFQREEPPEQVSFGELEVDPAAWQARAAVFRSVFKALSTMDSDFSLDSATYTKAENAAAKALEAVAQKLGGVEVGPWAKEIAGEIAGLGMIDRAFDEGAEEIFIRAHDEIYITTDGVTERSSAIFSASEALDVIANRLGGSDYESGELKVVTGHHGDGIEYTLLGPQAEGKAPVLCLRKSKAHSKTFEEMESAGVLSPAMTDFLMVCLKTKRNILLCGANGADVGTLQQTLAGHVSNQERVLILEGNPRLSLDRAQCASLTVTDENRADLSKHLFFSRFDRVVAHGFSGSLLGAVLQHGGQVQSGNIIACHAGSVRHGLSQMAMALSSYEPGSVFTTQAQVAGAIDVVVHVARDSSGQDRVTEITETLDVEVDFITLQTLFRCDAAASKDKANGVFHATGHLPRFYEDLQRWGLDVNREIFKA